MGFVGRKNDVQFAVIVEVACGIHKHTFAVGKGVGRPVCVAARARGFHNMEAKGKAVVPREGDTVFTAIIIEITNKVQAVRKTIDVETDLRKYRDGEKRGNC